jgi:hypothetical protein
MSPERAERLIFQADDQLACTGRWQAVLHANVKHVWSALHFLAPAHQAYRHVSVLYANIKVRMKLALKLNRADFSLLQDTGSTWRDIPSSPADRIIFTGLYCLTRIGQEDTWLDMYFVLYSGRWHLRLRQ